MDMKKFYVLRAVAEEMLQLRLWSLLNYGVNFNKSEELEPGVHYRLMAVLIRCLLARLRSSQHTNARC